MIDKMREQVVVQPSSSLCASPVVLVPKKDGDLRFGVDYRRLNAVTHKDYYTHYLGLRIFSVLWVRQNYSQQLTWPQGTGR